MRENKFAECIKGTIKLEGASLYHAIVENRKMGEKCGCHDFSIPLENEKIVCEKWQCSQCGTVVDGKSKVMYELGFEHGKKLNT